MTSPRTVNFADSSTDKGMNRPETVDLYTRWLSKNKLFYKRVAKRALRLKPDAEEIVDIGTGPGFVAIELARLTEKKIKAVDLSPNMLKKADELAINQGVNIETIEASCEKLPFEGSSIDLLTAVTFIHMLEDPLPFLREAKRVLEPSGRLLISAYRRDTWFWFRWLSHVVSSAIFKNRALDGFGAVLDASLTKEELTELLEKAGFTNFRVFIGFVRMEAVIGS